MFRGLKISVTLAALALMTGCSITQKVDPVPAGTQIDKVWIQHESATHNEGFEPALVNAISGSGFKAQVFNKNEQSTPGEFVMRYTANWRWDLAMYLEYFKADMFKGDEVIGTVTYDARHGSSSLKKFGKTANKIDPLIKELLKNASPLEQITANAKNQ